jgi:hypothetical protein
MKTESVFGDLVYLKKIAYTVFIMSDCLKSHVNKEESKVIFGMRKLHNLNLFQTHKVCR